MKSYKVKIIVKDIEEAQRRTKNHREVGHVNVKPE